MKNICPPPLEQEVGWEHDDYARLSESRQEQEAEPEMPIQQQHPIIGKNLSGTPRFRARLEADGCLTLIEDIGSDEQIVIYLTFQATLALNNFFRSQVVRDALLACKQEQLVLNNGSSR